MAVVEYEPKVLTEQVTETERRARTLEAAALEIELRGHAKFALMWESDMENPLWPANRKGSVCAIGAIYCTQGWNGGRFGGPFPASLFSDWAAVVDFNNDPTTESWQVPFLFRWRAEEIRDGWDA